MISHSLADTKKIAQDFSKDLITHGKKKIATVVGLYGDLGSGKTAFVQAAAEIFGVKEITSPTFIIERIYKTKNDVFPTLVHVDAYRLDNGGDLKKLGFEKSWKIHRHLSLSNGRSVSPRFCRTTSVSCAGLFRRKKENMKSFSKKLILLDSHAILHRAYHALPDFSTAAGVPTGALYGLSLMLLRIIEDFKPDYIVAAYDLPKPTYRHEAFKDYKAGRAKTDEALVEQIKNSRKIFDAFNIPIYDKEGFEADDVIGTIVEDTKKDKSLEVVIASGDMDTLQLVSGEKVEVFTLKKGIKDTILYNEKAVEKRFGFGPELITDYKGLRGDPSDNIPGIKGIGEKTATILISNFGAIEKIYAELKKGDDKFLKAKITPRIVELLRNGEEDAEFSKMLATIRRDAPIDFSLPKKTFVENIDFKKIDALFSELEFRTLGPRIKAILEKQNNTAGISEDSGARKSERSAQATESSEIPATLDAEKFKEAKVMLWLINSNLSDPKIEDIYAHTKTNNFAEAYEKLAKEIGDKKLSLVYEEIERPLIPIVEKMNAVGVKLDAEILKKLSVEYGREAKNLEEKIWSSAGKEFNINSPKQLSEILFITLGLKAKNQKKTSSGTFSTKESELEKLRDEHPIIENILNYRELKKLLGTYIEPMPALVDRNSRLHATFIQTGTTTGRMSSENPNLQNIPNKNELGQNIRRAFVTEKGNELLSLDYSQIELRIAAFLSGDKKLISIFKNGEDVHTAVAAEVFGVAQKDVTKEMRRRAKVINFGVMYGMGVNALRVNLGTDRAAAQKFLTDYFEKFSGLASYLKKLKKKLEKKGIPRLCSVAADILKA